MPTSPSSSFSTLRPDLRDTLMEFDLAANQRGMVGLQIAPVLEVDKPFGQFGKVELKELLKTKGADATLRAPDGSYQRGSGKGTKDSYATEEHGWEERVDDREATMYGDWWDAEQLAAQRVQDAVLESHNGRVITASLAGSNTNAAGTVWSTTGSADPIANVRAGKIAMRGRLGITPNAMCIDWEAYEYLRDNDVILARIKYSGHHDVQKKNVSVQMIADALDLDELIVSGAVKNTANDLSAASLASQWDRTKALLFVKRTDRNLKVPQFMRTFHWGADGSTIGGVIEDYRDESRRSDIIRCRMETDEKVLMTAASQIITGVLA